LVIEALTEMPFSAFMYDNIFEPAKIKDSYQQLTLKDNSTKKVVGDYPTYLNGVTVHVTPIDLMKFENALTSNLLIPFADVQTKLDGDELSGQNNRALYDFGSFSKDSMGTLLRWKHDGSNPSHHTLKFHDFENDLVIIIMSSDGNKSTLYQIKEKIVERLAASAD
jgi:CubicO group peptidase (beta-lactamase class C family)